MALIHHPALSREVTVPDKTVHIWERSGWVSGPLPKSRPRQEILGHSAVENTAPESGDSTTPPQED